MVDRGEGLLTRRHRPLSAKRSIAMSTAACTCCLHLLPAHLSGTLYHLAWTRAAAAADD